MKWITDALMNCGAAAVGAVSIERLAEHVHPDKLRSFNREARGAKSIIVALFPYFAGFQPGNISLYARGTDYHISIKHRLNAATGGMIDRYYLDMFVPYIDDSPFPEVAAAALCGLGMLGANGLIISPPHGSFCFIGTVITSRHIDMPRPVAPCKMCGKCAVMCPTGAITEKGVDRIKCLSNITQRRGVLTPGQREAVKAAGMVWGCDICQKVCPLNRDLAHTTLPEFSSGLVHSLTERDAELSDEQFKAKYGNRAFAWRGPEPLRRNIAIIGE